MLKRNNVERSKQEPRGQEATASPVTETSLKSMRLGDSKQELLPGIPNEITLSMIIPKLSWSNFSILSSVSRGWEKAIQSQLVYKARVRSHSTDTLVVILDKGPEIDGYDEHMHRRGEVPKVTLYSMKDQSWIELPPIPDFSGYLSEREPLRCQCIALEGKIYVFPGDESTSEAGNKEVYMLDLAGERKWKQCASMLQRRNQFGLAVMDGKIYVFGGLLDYFETDPGSEVYDPKTDCWSLIKPMTYFDYGHRVATIGEELFMYDREKLRVRAGVNPKVSSFGEVYNPRKDEWRLIDQFERNLPKGIISAAQGKFYVIGNKGCDIYVLDMDIQSSALLQSSFFPDIGGTGIVFVDSCLVVDDELLLLVTVLHMKAYHRRPVDLNGYIPKYVPRYDRYAPRSVYKLHVAHGTLRSSPRSVRLVKSKGFGQGSKAIVWETITRPHEGKQCADFENRSLLCSLQL